MDILKAIILGIVQGATEFLPVSSSGHLSVAQHVLGVNTETGILFDLMLHVGTLAAVFFVFRQLIGRLICEFFRMIKDLFTGKFCWSAMSHDRRMVMMLIIGLLPLLLFFLPLPGTDGNLKDFMESFYEDSTILLEGFCFLFTGALLMIAHVSSRHASGVRYRNKKDLTVGNALTVGVFQGIATLPGVSRSGSTLAAGLFCGLDKQTALDYSFILGIPAILGASLLQVKDAVAEKAQVELLPLLAGVIVSAIVGFFAIKLLKLVLKKDRLNVFAIYCLVLGLACVVIGLIEASKGINIFSGSRL
ncbi:MAG: undecaprenyl-diphosphate phosphatase [Firmicutes bacterium]|nr:undecaprenyl-diphosphate phosphatase [Bacillota bacterium]